MPDWAFNGMDQLIESVWLTFYFLLRCALPLALTLLLAYGLSRLDARWAREARAAAMGRTAVPYTPCWQIRGCSPAKREYCPAFYQPERPCWDVFSQGDKIRQQCLECRIYQSALFQT